MSYLVIGKGDRKGNFAINKKKRVMPAATSAEKQQNSSQVSLEKHIIDPFVFKCVSYKIMSLSLLVPITKWSQHFRILLNTMLQEATSEWSKWTCKIKCILYPSHRRTFRFFLKSICLTDVSRIYCSGQMSGVVARPGKCICQRQG